VSYVAPVASQALVDAKEALDDIRHQRRYWQLFARNGNDAAKREAAEKIAAIVEAESVAVERFSRLYDEHAEACRAAYAAYTEGGAA